MSTITQEYRQYKLDNGLVVALQKTQSQTITGKLRVHFGPFYERDSEDGMSHLLEHCLCSGGSEKYDPLAADEIRGSIGYFNASTSIGGMSFDGHMLKEDVGVWLNYVADHILRPRFDEIRKDQESERILREISDEKSDPLYPVNREFNAVFYNGHPKGRNNIGKEEVVRNITGEQLRNFHSRGFYPDNMDLIIVGELPDNIEEVVYEHFGAAPKGNMTRKKMPEMEPLQGKHIMHWPAPERYNADHPDESSATFWLSSQAPPESHPDEYAVRIMSQILGGDTNSFLFNRISLEKGLAYSVHTSYDGYFKCGRWSVNASVPAKRIDEAVDAIFEEMNGIKTRRVSDKVLESVKHHSTYHLVTVLEGNGGRVLAIEEKLDRGWTLEACMKGFAAVTPDRVLEVANRYLPDQKTGDYVLYIGDPLKK